MAFVLTQHGIGNLSTPFYAGFSGDERPRPDVATATLLELDTRRVFVWQLERKEWLLFSAPVLVPDNSEVLSEVAMELRKIRHGLEMYFESEIPDPKEE